MKYERTSQEIVDLIETKLKISFTEKQKKSLNSILKNYCWLPSDYNYIKVYKVYKELKAANEAELAMINAKANTLIASKDKTEAQELKLRIALLRVFNDKLNNIISEYKATIISYAKSFNYCDDGMLFIYMYLDGLTVKDIMKKTGFSLTKVMSAKKRYDKLLNNTQRYIV